MLSASGEDYVPNTAEWKSADHGSQYRVGRDNFLFRTTTQFHWTFIVGLIVSLAAIIFGYDAISGEKEAGTLRLILANPVPRAQVLWGKFLGLAAVLGTILVVGFLLAVTAAVILGHIALEGGDFLRIFIFFAGSLLYAAVFLALALLVSSVTHSANVSLVFLLLLWVVLVVVIPGTGDIVARGLYRTQSQSEVEGKLRKGQEAIHAEFEKKRIAGEVTTEEDWRRWHADLWRAIRASDSKIFAANRTQQFTQTRLGRNLTRISPRGLFSFVAEGLAGTGLGGQLRFDENGRRYANQFGDFIIAKDKLDPESLHLYFQWAGLSEKPVDPDEIPIFKETDPTLSESLKAAFVDLTILFLMAMLAMMGAHLAFLRYDVR
jgi:ABC-type transport system involved in multi-copper enzyme maturation permease subunit